MKKFEKKIEGCMFVAVGVSVYEGKILVSQRTENWPETDFFEFPSVIFEEVDSNIVLEDALEQRFFEISGCKGRCFGCFPAFCCERYPNVRFFPFYVKVENFRKNCEKNARWVNFDKICKLKLSSQSVMLVKSLKKIS